MGKDFASGRLFRSRSADSAGDSGVLLHFDVRWVAAQAWKPADRGGPGRIPAIVARAQ